MSIEEFPSNGHTMPELLELCENALSQEDWTTVERSEMSKFNSFQYCEELARAFQRSYHLVKHPIDGQSKDYFPYFSQLTLRQPRIFMPKILRDGSNLTYGSPIDRRILYSRISIETSSSSQGQYSGPHLVGVCYLEVEKDEELLGVGLETAYYYFQTPMRTVEVVEDQRTYSFN